MLVLLNIILTIVFVLCGLSIPVMVIYGGFVMMKNHEEHPPILLREQWDNDLEEAELIELRCASDDLKRIMSEQHGEEHTNHSIQQSMERARKLRANAAVTQAQHKYSSRR